MDEDMKTGFINGEIVIHSPAFHKHNAAVMFLSKLLNAYVSERELGIVTVEKALIELTRNSYEPDICYFGPEKATTTTPHMLYYPAPDLVVVVLSKSTKKNDQEIKFNDYAAHGAAKYWLVDHNRQTVEVFTLDTATEAYAQLGTFRVGELVSSQLLTGFTIPVRAVFESGLNVTALRALLV